MAIELDGVDEGQGAGARQPAPGDDEVGAAVAAWRARLGRVAEGLGRDLEGLTRPGMREAAPDGPEALQQEQAVAALRGGVAAEAGAARTLWNEGVAVGGGLVRLGLPRELVWGALGEAHEQFVAGGSLFADDPAPLQSAASVLGEAEADLLIGRDPEVALMRLPDVPGLTAEQRAAKERAASDELQARGLRERQAEAERRAAEEAALDERLAAMTPDELERERLNWAEEPDRFDGARRRVEAARLAAPAAQALRHRPGLAEAVQEATPSETAEALLNAQAELGVPPEARQPLMPAQVAALGAMSDPAAQAGAVAALLETLPRELHHATLRQLAASGLDAAVLERGRLGAEGRPLAGRGEPEPPRPPVEGATPPGDLPPTPRTGGTPAPSEGPGAWERPAFDPLARARNGTLLMDIRRLAARPENLAAVEQAIDEAFAEDPYATLYLKERARLLADPAASASAKGQAAVDLDRMRRRREAGEPLLAVWAEARPSIIALERRTGLRLRPAGPGLVGFFEPDEPDPFLVLPAGVTRFLAARGGEPLAGKLQLLADVYYGTVSPEQREALIERRLFRTRGRPFTVEDRSLLDAVENAERLIAAGYPPGEVIAQLAQVVLAEELDETDLLAEAALTLLDFVPGAGFVEAGIQLDEMADALRRGDVDAAKAAGLVAALSILGEVAPVLGDLAKVPLRHLAEAVGFIQSAAERAAGFLSATARSLDGSGMALGAVVIGAPAPRRRKGAATHSSPAQEVLPGRMSSIVGRDPLIHMDGTMHDNLVKRLDSKYAVGNPYTNAEFVGLHSASELMKKYTPEVLARAKIAAEMRVIPHASEYDVRWFVDDLLTGSGLKMLERKIIIKHNGKIDGGSIPDAVILTAENINDLAKKLSSDIVTYLSASKVIVIEIKSGAGIRRKGQILLEKKVDASGSESIVITVYVPQTLISDAAYDAGLAKLIQEEGDRMSQQELSALIDLVSLFKGEIL